MLSFIISCLLYYVVPFSIYRIPRIWESFSSVPEQEFTEAVSSHARSSTYYVIVTCLYVKSVTFSIAVAWVIFRRLPLRVKYEIYAGMDTLRLLFIVTHRQLQSLSGKVFRVNAKEGCRFCDEVSTAFKATCVEAEILNFCLSVPRDSEKYALAAAVKMKRKQEQMIDAYNAKLKALEDSGVDVDLDKLIQTPGRLETPFSEEALNLDLLKKYDVSLTKYVPYEQRIERDRPWFPSLVAARKKSFRENLQDRKKYLHPSTVKETHSNSSLDKHFRMSFGRRHSENSMQGQSRSTPLSDIIGFMGDEPQIRNDRAPSGLGSELEDQSQLRGNSSDHSPIGVLDVPGSDVSEMSGIRSRSRLIPSDHRHQQCTEMLDPSGDRTHDPVALNLILALSSENEDDEDNQQDETAIVRNTQQSRIPSGSRKFSSRSRTPSRTPPSNRNKQIDRSEIRSARSHRSATKREHPTPNRAITPTGKFSFAELLLRNKELKQRAVIRKLRNNTLSKQRNKFSSSPNTARNTFRSPSSRQEVSAYLNYRAEDQNSFRPPSRSLLLAPTSVDGDNSSLNRDSSTLKHRSGSRSKPGSSPVATDKIMPASELQIEPSMTMRTSGAYDYNSRDKSLAGHGVRTYASEALDQFSMTNFRDTLHQDDRNEYSSREASMPDDTSVMLSVPDMTHVAQSNTADSSPRRKTSASSDIQRAVRFEEKRIKKPKLKKKKSKAPVILVQTESTNFMTKQTILAQNHNSGEDDETEESSAGDSEEVEARKSSPRTSGTRILAKGPAGGKISRRLTTSPQTTWGYNTIKTVSAVGSYQGDYKVLPDFGERHWDVKTKTLTEKSSLSTSEAEATDQEDEVPPSKLVMRFAQEQEIEPVKFRMIQYDENLQTYRKVEVTPSQ